MRHEKYNQTLCNAISWFVFLCATVTYWATADRYASFWDCPEYITTASLLEVGHPPGNPFWTLFMRVVTIPFPQYMHAFVINLWSGIFMAFAAFFLSRIAFIFGWWLSKRWQIGEGNRNFCVACSSAGSALSFAFTDSAWFSAVEAEVYAMSAFITSLSLWLMLIWYKSVDRGKRDRLIVLIAYITGLSLGVHQLNLLMIPVFSLIWLYRRHRGKIKWYTLCGGMLLSALGIFIVLGGIMPGLLALAGMFELTAVNAFHLPYFTGVIICVIVIFATFALAISMCMRFRVALMVVMSLGAIIIGYSTFALILIRGMANTPMNEASPTDIFSLASYVARDQYGTVPLLRGPSPYSRPMFEEHWEVGKNLPTYTRYVLKKGNSIWRTVYEGARLNHRSRMLSSHDSLGNRMIKNVGKGYLLSDYRFSQVTTPELDMWFPRLTHSSPADIKSYEEWTGMNGNNMEEVQISETIESLGHPVGLMTSPGERERKIGLRPTYVQNLQFFLKYQIFYMYLRYFFWNFIGRQNDLHSTGEIDHGNFITGIPPIDTLMIGDQSLLPPSAGYDNPGRNVYFGIPFLIGIIGMAFLASGNRKRRRILAIIGLFFIMTGVAIVVYLNQGPGEPRERDYSFLGSYMAFAILIGLGGLGVGSMLAARRTSGSVVCGVVGLLSLASPILMFAENIDDHNRLNRGEPERYAARVLDIEDPLIIFTQGDNYTFPLWYTQEVLGKGVQHTIVDMSYLSTPEYVVNLMAQNTIEDNIREENAIFKGLNLNASPADLLYGAYALIPFAQDADSSLVSLSDALKQLYSQKEGTPLWRYPNVYITSGDGKDTIYLDITKFTEGKRFIPFRQLMLLDILASNLESENPKTMVFLNSVNRSAVGPLLEHTLKGVNGRYLFPSDSVSIPAQELALIFSDTLLPLPSYLDPVIIDRMRRERASLIILAEKLIVEGHLREAEKIAVHIADHIPYEKIPAGAISNDGTNFREGIKYIDLLMVLYDKTGDKHYLDLVQYHLDLFQNATDAWKRYYLSIPKERRNTVSNTTLIEITSQSHLDSISSRLQYRKGNQGI